MSSSMEFFCIDCVACMLPFWAAIAFGVLIGWAWRPAWANSLLRAIRNMPCESWTTSSGRAMLAWRGPPGDKITAFQQADGHCCPCSSAIVVPSKKFSNDNGPAEPVKDKSMISQSLASTLVGERDLLELYKKVHGKEGGLSWDLMMERSAHGITYKAWRRDPQNGPTEYRSQTIFEDSTPELVKDFLWDDEFRSVWDDMLIFSNSKEDCMETGAEIVHWVRKFPFFCSDREYLIGRRIFELNGAFYCVTKAVPYEAVPRRDKPLRVDIYNSSWCICAAESAKKKGQWTACEVLFFHAEDMHIPKNIAKFGVRQGMWGCVRKMEPGLRKYQAYRDTAKSLSKSARMAQLYTKMPATCFDTNSMFTSSDSCGDQPNEHDSDLVKAEVNPENQAVGWKWLIIGGAIVLTCTLDRGVLGRTLICGVARKLGSLNHRVR